MFHFLHFMNFVLYLQINETSLNFCFMLFGFLEFLLHYYTIFLLATNYNIVKFSFFDFNGCVCLAKTFSSKVSFNLSLFLVRVLEMAEIEPERIALSGRRSCGRCHHAVLRRQMLMAAVMVGRNIMLLLLLLSLLHLLLLLLLLLLLRLLMVMLLQVLKLLLLLLLLVMDG